MTNRLTAFLFLSFICLSSIKAQLGVPYIKNYTHKEYSKEFEAAPQNWSIVQDKRGIVYFGNGMGVLQYDGSTWRMIEIPNHPVVRSLDIDSSGVIYVGTQGDFGYLEPTKNGELEYVSLLPHLTEEQLEFGDVWRTHTLGNKVYFNAYNTLYIWDHEKFEVLEFENGLYPSWVVNNTFFARQKNVGLVTFENSSVKVIHEEKEFNNDVIYSINNFDGLNYLIGTKSNGIYISNLQDPPEPFTSSADGFLKENQIYYSIQLNELNYTYATAFGGVAIVSKGARLTQILNKSAGLQDEAVKCLYQDNQKGLWIALNNGITRAESSSPLTVFNDKNGLEGTVESIIRHQNILYVATDHGVFYIDRNTELNGLVNIFKPIEGIGIQGWDLVTIEHDNSEELLASTDNGIYRIENFKAKLIYKIPNATVMHPSINSPNILYIGTSENGLAYLKYTNDTWVEGNIYKEIKEDVRFIEEEANGNIWLGTVQQNIIKIDIIGKDHDIQIGNITRYNTENGLPIGENYVATINGQLKFFTPKGLFKIDDNSYKNIQFTSDTILGKSFGDGSVGISRLVEDIKGNVWMFTYKGNKVEIGEALLSSKGTYIWKTNPFSRIPKQFIYAIYPDIHGVTWFGGSEGIVRYNSNLDNGANYKISTLIRNVTVGKDSTVFNGAFFDSAQSKNGINTLAINQTEQFEIKLPFSLNSLSIEFASPSFDNENVNKYQYKLDGFDQEWSTLSFNTNAKYTNLPEGKYDFLVRGKNIYNQFSDEAQYKFSILSPWYRTAMAYISYFFSLVGLIFLTVSLYTKKLKAENLRLENIVQERTKEISEQKDDIERQKEIIEESRDEIAAKNKDITDSINYAKKIQEAILPDQRDIRTTLPNSFVLFKPKDIVSGDFYWFADNDDGIIIAACDCTGHGVPGAFMSMIGNDILNQIVLEKGITKPSEILNNLHLGIRQALGQEKEDSKAKDGLDLALCNINEKNKKVQFSGAYNSLYLIAKNIDKRFSKLIDGKKFKLYQSENNKEFQLLEIRADRFGIGGESHEVSRKFTNHQIDVEEGDTLYLFSDGYQDQFGGPHNKKFSSRRVKELILSNQSHDMAQQGDLLLNEIEKWKANHEQIDDILFIGVKIG
ncbi:MAG: hypothetical protein COC01_05740 [Bacteroidetes bacterium]|nr:MAG: hypothetical protein COC01_05740 [Bacteroidota bacterium]